MEIRGLLEHFLEDGVMISKGAESNLYKISYYGKPAVLKYRVEKKYRIKELDKKIRRRRTFGEASSIYEAWKKGINVPRLLYADLERYYLIMEYLEGEVLREAILKKKYTDEEISVIASSLGEMIANLHNIDIVHGDLTTANIIIKDELRPYLIDFGLSERRSDPEAKAVDIEMFYRVLESTHTMEREKFFNAFIQAYKKNVLNSKEIISRFNRIRRMGRYIEERRRRS